MDTGTSALCWLGMGNEQPPHSLLVVLYPWGAWGWLQVWPRFSVSVPPGCSPPCPAQAGSTPDSIPHPDPPWAPAPTARTSDVLLPHICLQLFLSTSVPLQTSSVDTWCECHGINHLYLHNIWSCHKGHTDVDRGPINMSLCTLQFSRVSWIWTQQSPLLLWTQPRQEQKHGRIYSGLDRMGDTDLLLHFSNRPSSCREWSHHVPKHQLHRGCQPSKTPLLYKLCPCIDLWWFPLCEVILFRQKGRLYVLVCFCGLGLYGRREKPSHQLPPWWHLLVGLSGCRGGPAISSWGLGQLMC